MSMESARQFLADAQKDKILHKAVHQCVLARDAETMVKLGERRGFEFTSLEIKQAVVNFWEQTPVPKDWQGLDIDVARLDPDQIDFFLHRANRDYLLGKRHIPILRHRGMLNRHYVVLAIIAIGLTLFFGWGYYVSQNDYMELRDHGVTTTGEVIRLHKQSGFRYSRYSLGPSYDMTYEFTVKGVDYQRRQNISSEQFQSTHIGQFVEILYSPSDPSVSVLVGTNSSPLLIFFIALAFGAIAGLAVGKGLYDYRLEVAYRKQGTLMLGKITGLKRDKYVLARRDGFHANTLDVAFDSPNRQQIITDSVRHGWSLSRQYAPHKGDTIAIFYVDTNHWWVL
ncbi:MAG: Nif11 family protein [Anaerolineae bacterium]|nr:MAG: Nif11 family protein [Anaerolineae bacterium]